jgi:hypothetical protein
MTWGWRARLVLTAGFLALVSSVLPWWELRERIGADAGAHYAYHYGNAWTMSTRWTVAILLAVGVVAVFGIWRAVRGSVPLPARLILGAVAAVAVSLVVWQWFAIERLTPENSNTVAIVSVGDPPKTDPIVDAWMQRDHLASYHSPGLYADVAWGMWVALAALLVLAIALVVPHRGSPAVEPTESA